MVALFGSSAKVSSTSFRKAGSTSTTGAPDTRSHRPQDHPSAVNHEGTSRTESVATPLTETVHFLSFPLWKKRTNYNFSKDATSNAKLPQTISPSNSYLMDKELPPTPVDHAAYSAHSPSPPGEFGEFGERMGSVPPPQIFPGFYSSLDQTSCPQSTSALAHAVLDVGLTHALPRTSSSSSSAANTVSFTLPSSTTEASVSFNHSVRKSKSTQLLETRPSFGSSPNGRRIRGLSFGTSSFLQFPVNDSKGKEKAKEQDFVEDHIDSLPEKQLSRKTSFWSRKRSIQTGEVSTPPNTISNELSLPSLPDVQPASPFDMPQLMATTSERPADTRSYHDRGLSRSYSAREDRREPGYNVDNDLDFPVKNIARGTPKRPSTAGAKAIPHKNSQSFLQTSASPHRVVPGSADYSEAFPGEQVRSSLQRPRALTTPPLLHRLSLNMFQSSNAQSKANVNTADVSQMTAHSASKEIPKLKDNESPEAYLSRLQLSVAKKDMAGILASSTDPVYCKALRAYIGIFDFTNNALDIALRKLLMEVGLPHETQQIDRVIEAFATHYVHCNPSLFSSDDHPYILAFSLIMLHTDAFNKSNKHKMTKADYVKNTRLPGVAQEVLEYFYDNIVFAPFIFIEEPLEPGALSTSDNRLSMSTASTPISAVPSGNSLLLRNNKVDPYYLIGNNLLDPLRVTMDTWITADNLYSTYEYEDPRDAIKVHDAFFQAKRIYVELPSSSHTVASSLANREDMPSRIVFPERQTFALKVAKCGLLQRKDDLLEGGKRALHRKWRTWTVILAGFQLLFFRDTSLAATILSTQSFSSEGEDMISANIFQPDELVSVKDSIAVFDKSYHKHRNTLRFVLADGKQMLLQASEEKDIDEWISRINYASTFKSTGVRMRSPTMATLEVELTGVAAATSHLHDMQRTRFPIPLRSSASISPSPEGSTTDTTSANQLSLAQQELVVSHSYTEPEVNIPMAPEIDGADRLKATFDSVKAELASNTASVREDIPEAPNRRDYMTSSGHSSFSFHKNFFSTRSHIIKRKIEDLESKISSIRHQLEDTMQLIHNISILTPFQKSTRDRLFNTVQATASDIKRIRLELAKYGCYHGILLQDITVEEQEWNRTRNVALRAAKETLHRQISHNVPRMTLSMHGDDEAGSAHARSLSNCTTDKAESSTCGSFHSALDLGPEWPSDELSGGFLSMPQFVESPRPSTSESLSSFPFNNVDDSLGGSHPRSSSVDELSMSVSPENKEVCEQAEAWDETRYAQRVSLIRVPSGIALHVRGRRL